jgi:hypothetical protein
MIEHSLAHPARTPRSMGRRPPPPNNARARESNPPHLAFSPDEHRGQCSYHSFSRESDHEHTDTA